MEKDLFKKVIKLDSICIEENYKCGTITINSGKGSVPEETKDDDNDEVNYTNEQPIEEPCAAFIEQECDINNTEDVLNIFQPDVTIQAKDTLMVIVGEEPYDTSHDNISGSVGIDPLAAAVPPRKRKKKRSLLTKSIERKRKVREKRIMDALASNRERQRKRRETETAAEYARRLERNRTRVQRLRGRRQQKESEEQAALRRARATAQTRIRRELQSMRESAEEAAARRAYCSALTRERRQRKREMETEEERQQRLIVHRLKARSYRARRYATETLEERRQRREVDAMRTRHKRAMQRAFGMLDLDNMTLAELAYHLQLNKRGSCDFIKIEPSNES